MGDKQNIFLSVVFLVSLALISKLIHIQFFDTKFKQHSGSAAVTRIDVEPTRGLIYDRSGKLLVNNEPVYTLLATYNKIDPEMDTSLFCQLLNIEKADFIKSLNPNWKSNRYTKNLPFVFLDKIPPKVFAKFQEHLFRFPGFRSKLQYIRSYPNPSAAHVLGYIGEVDSTQIKKSNNEYKAGDYWGQSGLEYFYEKDLKGIKGFKYLLKDNLGREVGEYDGGSLDSNATTGQDVFTTLDISLQSYGEKLMTNKRGSIVAIEPKTGEILASITAPHYDPNLFNLNQDRGKSFKSLMLDTINKPLLNRATMAKYPPGSIFKCIFSLIALQEEITYPNRTIYCDGAYVTNEKKGFSQGCHEHPTPYNIGIALQHSCNSYFYQLMREFIEKYGYNKPQLGLADLHRYLEEFGLGKDLGVDMPNEAAGLIPTPEYYDKQYSYVRSGWRSTYILSLGIGQGELELTTLQMANLAAIIANKGYYITPHFRKNLGDDNTQKYRLKNKVSISPKHFDPIIAGMKRVVTMGTGQIAAIPGIDICGKTGTSQNPHGKDHSVFFAFAPIEDPQIAIAVYVENAGFGAEVAAPIASLMMEQYINKEIMPSRKNYEKYIKEKDLISQI